MYMHIRVVDTFQKVGGGGGGLESKVRCAHTGNFSCDHTHIGDKRSSTASSLDDK